MAPNKYDASVPDPGGVWERTSYRTATTILVCCPSELTLPVAMTRQRRLPGKGLTRRLPLQAAKTSETENGKGAEEYTVIPA